MKLVQSRKKGTANIGGLAGWLLARVRGGSRPQPKLALVERISLAPRQSLSLVEADGRRFLIASSPEGAPAFYALDEQPRLERAVKARVSTPLSARVSW